MAKVPEVRPKRTVPKKKRSPTPDTLAAERREALAVETDGLSVRLAEGLAKARAEHRLTQEQAAERASLDPRMYRKVESGVSNATLTTLRRLGVAFQVLDPLTLFAPPAPKGGSR